MEEVKGFFSLVFEGIDAFVEGLAELILNDSSTALIISSSSLLSITTGCLGVPALPN